MTKPRMRGLFNFSAGCSRRKLQRVAFGFQRADTLFELDDIRRLRQIFFATITFGGFKPDTDFFEQECKHDFFSKDFK